ncbi:MAG: flagellar basal body P-ring formation chaperone FlgA [Nitrospirales bacterium]
MKIILFLIFILCGPGWGTVEQSVSAGAGSSATVDKDGQWVQAGDFERVVLRELMRRYGRPHHQMSLRVLFPSQVMEVPRGNLHLEVGEWSGGGRAGRRAFRVGVFVDKQFIKTVNVTVEVKVQAEVATPIRWLKPRDVVTSEDLAPMMVDVPSLTHDFVLKLEEAVGKQVVRPLSPGQPIRKTMLDYPPLIHKGDRVLIEAKSGGLLVQTVGVAKAAGKAGETISVKNQASGRDVLGIVMASGLVEVKF